MMPITSRTYKRLITVFSLWTFTFLLFKLSSPPETPEYSASGPSRSLLNADYVLPTTRSPHIDTSVLSDNQLLTKVDSSNLPLAYWAKIRKHKQPKAGNAKCTPEFPSLFDLDYNNIYWQRLATNNGTYYLYSAYYDDRVRGGPTANVRILAMIDRLSPPPLTCLLWYDRPVIQPSSSAAGNGNNNGTNANRAGASATTPTPVLSTASYIYGWYPKWGNYKDGLLQPFIISCKVPGNVAPTSVSLIPKLCAKPSNNLAVNNYRPKVKQDFAVCVKGLDFLHEDLSVRLIEWIELLRILGTSKIFLYELEVHPNISKVLKYYQELGVVSLTKTSLPGSQPNLLGFRHLYLKNKLTTKRQNELIPYNDCLYRNIHAFRYVVLLDIDEIIMPLKATNWSDLMAEVERQSLRERNYSRASYNVRNVYFLDDLGTRDALAAQSQSSSIASPSSSFSLPSSQSSSSSSSASPPASSQSSSSSASASLSSSFSSSSSSASSSSSSPSVPFSSSILKSSDNIISPENSAAAAAASSSSSGTSGSSSSSSSRRVAAYVHTGHEPGIPSYMHMLQHVYRSHNYTKPGQYVKCFHNTERVVSLHNHFPLKCFGSCTTYSIDTKLAHLQHYRKDCVGPLKSSCKTDFRVYTVRDTTIWRYKDELIRAVDTVLSKLGFFEG